MKEKFDKLSAECSKITTQRYSTSFSLGIYFLDKELRDPIYGIYGFVRFADEIVDSFHGYNKRYLFEKFKSDCFEAIEEGISLNPILNSFQQVVKEYHIDHELIHRFLNSMEMDLEQRKYTPEKYEEYILGSAEVVGLMCLKVFTGGNEESYQSLKLSAMKLGSAFQKINFLRDIQADYQLLDRTYFPDVNLSQFSNYDKQEIEYEIESELTEALTGIKQLPGSSRRGVYLAYCYYRKLLEKIRRSDARSIMVQRFRISNSRKFIIMLNSVVRHQMNAI